MKRVLSLALLLLISSASFSQIGRLYSSNKELSSSLINAIHQDKRGFIWVATEDGLNRLDGFNTKVYRPSPEDSKTIKNIYVTSIFEDSKGRLWFGCIDGIVLYSHVEDKFTDIPIKTENRLLKPYITSIIENEAGNIVLSTSGRGLFTLNDKEDNLEFKEITKINNSLKTLFINDIIEDSQNQLWLASESEGLYCMKKDGSLIKHFTAPGDLKSNSITAFCKDIDGKLFVGSLNGGVFIYNPQTKNFTQVGCAAGSNDLNVREIFVDSRNRVLVGTDGMGVWEYRRDLNMLKRFELSNTPFDLSRAKVHTIYEDRDKNLWFGLFQKGVLVLPCNRPQFDYYGAKTALVSPIGSSCVMGICRDNKGTVWVGTDNDGLYGIDDNGKQVKRFAAKGGANSIPQSITSLLYDSKGDLWIGSYSNGLIKFNPSTGSSINVKLDKNSPNEKNEKVFSLFEDKQSNLWIGTYGRGLYRHNLKTGDVQHYMSSSEDQLIPNRLSNNWVNCITQSRSGYIWIGTFNGLSCLNPINSNFTKFENRYNLLPGHAIHQVLEGHDGAIWIGTSQGLFCYNPNTKKMKHYTSKDGLTNNIVCGIEEDEANNIWISTHNGISKFNIGSETFVSYYAPNWIHNNEYTRGASFKDARGKVYFGGVEGITAFFPSQVRDQKKQKEIQITNLSLLNKAVRYGDKSGGRKIFKTALSDVSELKISYADNIFTLNFSIFNFVNPEEVIFQYRIEEINNAWVTLPPGANSVTLTGLLPGKYTLSLRAETGSLFSPVKQVVITITPPWYKTILAKIFYLILLSGLGYLAYQAIVGRIREKHELLQNRHLKELNEQKLQYFINISHEIRTPMSLILAPLEKLQKTDATQENQRLYHLMRANAEKILQLVNQLMDIRKLEMGQMVLKFREVKLTGYLHSISDLLEPQLARKSATLRINDSHNDLSVWIDPNNFDKVIFNLLSNALKFVPEKGEISIDLEIEKGENQNSGYIRIVVEDNGIGIEPDKIEKIFERYYQISNNVTKSNIGTGIGLHLSRLMVDLHHGTIWAENRENNQGARFIVRIPLGCAHLRSDEISQEKDPVELSCLPMLFSETDEAKPLDSSKRKSSGKRVLIVDDEPDIREFIRSELSSFYSIMEASNGQEALDIILKNKPDIVVSDVMMPEMNGIMLVKRMRQNININDIPVILLTAKTGLDDNIEGIEGGAEAYLTKPFNIDLLKSTIENLVHVRDRLKNKFSGNQDLSDKVEASKLSSADEVFLEKVIKIINKHLNDPQLNVEFIADKVGLSRVHVYRKLKALTNQSARDFIRNIRLKHASTLLAQKHHLIADVAYATGFVSVSHFSAAFKEFYGITPKEWMAKNKQEQAGKTDENGNEKHPLK